MKFLAILKDSFREAVDGWVIYVMLVLSALLIVLVASFSVEPVPADEAFREITHNFVIVYPDHGQGTFARGFGLSPQVDKLEKLTEASAPQEADYRFVLRFEDFGGTARPRVGRRNGAENDKNPPGDKKPEDEKPAATQFRQAVAYWSRPADKDQVFGFKEIDASAVTDEMTIEFVRDQFLSHGSMELTKLVKRPSSSENIEEFEIETKGLKGSKSWPHHPHLFFGLWKIKAPIPLGIMIYFIESTLVSDIGATIALLVSVVITAFFIPNLMRKGSIDLLLSKPLARPFLLLYKYIGGLTFMFLNTTFAVGGVWLMIGLRTGIWGTGLLWTILAVTYYFALLYAVSTLAAVMSRNAIVAILVTMTFWAAMFVVGFVHNKLEPYRNDKTVEIPKSVYTVTDTINATLPRTTDLDNLMNKWIVDDTLGIGEKKIMKKDKFTYPPWAEVLGVSGLYIGIMLGLACWRFSTRDY